MAQGNHNKKPYLSLRNRLNPPGLKHGFARRRGPSPEYVAWKAMRQRCTNPHKAQWMDYGGRGIRFCKRWEKFENFLADMGRKPTPQHSLDRFPNPDGNYSPKNCRWATRLEQRHNRRRGR